MLGVTPANIRINFTSPETGGIVLPDAENCTIVSSFVWTQYQNVTDRQTDGIPLDSTALCIASLHAVKSYKLNDYPALLSISSTNNDSLFLQKLWTFYSVKETG